MENEFILLPKETAEALIQHLNSYISALEQKVVQMRAEQRGEIPIKQVEQRMFHADELRKRLRDEALLVNHQRAGL